MGTNAGVTIPTKLQEATSLIMETYLYLCSIENVDPVLYEKLRAFYDRERYQL